MSNTKKAYNKFKQQGRYYVGGNADEQESPKLPPGVYELMLDPQSGIVFFHQTEINSDGIVDLPSTEYASVINQIEVFLKPATKALFDKYKFLYKRSALLHGLPGTGKTCIVNRVAQHVTANNGIVLFNPEPTLLTKVFEQLNDVQPESTVMIVFEEVDKIIERHEEVMLSILDGEIQKPNVIYVATTNFIDKIPPRICRPGRFSNIIEVRFPTAEVRMAYLRTKLEDRNEIDSLVRATDGFSIDELKEVIVSTKCLGLSLQEVLNRIATVKKSSQGIVEQKYDEDDPDYDDDYFKRAHLGMKAVANANPWVSMPKKRK